MGISRSMVLVTVRMRSAPSVSGDNAGCDALLAPEWCG